MGFEPDVLLDVRRWVWLGCVAARLLPVAFATPWLVLTGLPVTVRLALTAALMVGLGPCAAAHSALPDVASGWACLAWGLREASLGTVQALALTLPLLSVRWSGGILQVCGLGPDGDAIGMSGQAPLETLFAWVAVLLFFVTGAHLAVLELLADSLVRWPIATAPPQGFDAPALARSVAHMVTTALNLAASISLPVLAALLGVQGALGLLRLGPAAQLATLVTAPLRLLALWGAIWLTLRAWLPHWQSEAMAASLHALRRFLFP
ncbi:MAG: flagellar biosynthetic protein FliR [Polyangiales bacterium]